MELLRPLIDKLSVIHQTRGVVGLIDWCKNQRLALLHYLSGEYTVKRIKGVPLTRNGFPISLGTYLINKLDNITLLRLILTALYSTRALRTGKKPNTSPIEEPLTRNLPDLGKHVISFWKEMGYRPSNKKVPSRLKWRSFHMTTKAGPNGQALWTSMVDLRLLRNSKLLEDIGLIGGPQLQVRINCLSEILDLLPPILFPSEGSTLRRLSWFPDKESKTRVVAILDYWSQTALRPFHDYLFQVLKKIPQDCTFNQGSFVDKINGWEVFYSIDLTAATDRFPIQIISLVLRGLLPDWFVESWERIMVGHPFDFQGRKITYAVGNPMGAYSSWNSFTVAHHYIMYWCCKELGISWGTSKYCILGDDVLIGDTLLKCKYLEVITSLGVEISAIKTHESSKLFEFAKRLFLNGVEITPFPISALTEVSRKPYLLTSLLMEEEKRGWISTSGIPLAISGFYALVLSQGSRMRARAMETSYLSELMIKVMRGLLPANDALNSIVGRWELPLPNISPEVGLSILSGTALSVFVQGNPLDYKQGKPLGALAEDLVCSLTCIEYPEVVARTMEPSFIPVLNVFGQIEEEYMRISREAYLIDTIKGGEWPMHLRALALPISDKVFVERSSHTVYRVSSILGKKVLENLRGLRPSDFP